MDNVAAYDRIKSFLENTPNLSPEVKPPNEIKKDINVLVNKLERLRSNFPKLKNVDLSNHIYSMLM